MAFPTIFSQLPAGPSPLSQFDTMFNVVASMGTIACTASGTNTIALTVNTNMPAVNSYYNYQAFGFVAQNTTTSSVLLNLQSIGALPAYAADGVTQLGAGSLIINTFYQFIYNSALNSGAGGFQLLTVQSAGTALVASSLNGGPLAGFRNKIINGAMDIDQRYAGTATASSIIGYTVDRWCLLQTTTGKVVGQQNAASVTPPNGFGNYYGVTSQSAYTSASTDYYTFFQPLEGYNVTDLAFGTSSASSVTLSFWARSSLTGTFSGCIQSFASTRSYPFTYTISSANTWSYIRVTITGDTAGTWVRTGSGGSLNVVFDIGSGSNYRSTAGTWQTGDYLGVTGSVSVVGTSGATWYVTGVQLEAGSVATPFERRLFSIENSLCQRYFQMSYDLGTVPGSTVPGGAFWSSTNLLTNGLTQTSHVYSYSVRLRSTPTITFYSPTTGSSGKIRDIINGTDVTPSLILSAQSSFTWGGTASSNVMAAGFTGHFTSSAEL